MAALRAFREFVGETGFRIDLLLQVVRRLHHLPKRRRWLLDQLYTSGVQNLHVILLVGLFIGMIFALQTGIELAKFGQQDQIGLIVATGIAREMGPFITGIILAATVGSALAAELGTMAVSDELAALETLSIDRTSLLVLPRVASLAIMCPMLTVICDGISIMGGGFVAQSQLHVSWALYTDTAISALQAPSDIFGLPKDVYAGLFKSFIFGIIVAVISCASGLKVRGGALGVGSGTRQAVRDSIIAIIVANYFLTWFIYQN
ncbi:MAG: phospholipid/cholesterol/gamma-HCH transport system permease protein [Chlamydiales bacterium]|jgi:phospholipid/cholesterol/gamma-HCH transport system permease protein